MIIIKSNRYLLQFAIVVVFLSVLVYSHTAAANQQHSLGYATLGFGGVESGQKSDQGFKLGFNPTVIEDLMEDGSPNVWSALYTLEFNYYIDPNTKPSGFGFIRIGLQRKSGVNYFGNLDLFFNKAVTFDPKSANSMQRCELDWGNGWASGQILFEGQLTRTAICYSPIVINPGTKYFFELNPDDTLGNGWWNAFLTNDSTKEIYKVGSIKLPIKAAGLTLDSSYFKVEYIGPPKPCEKVPILDTLIWPVTSKISNSSFASTKILSQKIGPCTKAIFEPLGSSDPQGAYLLKFGGSDPKSRSGLSTGISTNTSQSSPSTTQIKPSLSFINITGNTLNLSVNVGSGSGKPDQIYLMAPQLSSLNGGKILGKMSGSKATWAIKLDKALSGKTIPLKIVGVKNGVESEAIQTNYVIPKNFVIINKPPVFPTPNTQTVICTRGQQSRAFVGKVCPPGWKG